MKLRSFFAASALALAATSLAQIGPLQYLGSSSIPTNSLSVGGTTVGGLSGIDYDALTNTYRILSDDRSETSGPYGRYYTANISLATGSPVVNFTGVNTIKTPSGGSFPANGIDPESIRYRNGLVYVSSEGDRDAPVQDPFVRSYDAAGNQVRDFAVPSKFLTSVAGQGVRDNLAFESLTFSTDGLSLYTATEGALMQDGPAATADNGSNARILKFDVASGLTKEFVYTVDPVAERPVAGNFSVNGLTELLAVDSTHLLALERSFTVNATPSLSGNTIKVYEIDLSAATDVSGVASVASLTGITPVAKRLVLDLNAATGLTPAQLDNVEGMTFGPLLPDGTRSLIFVSDNNFNSLVGTQFFAFKVQAVPEPGTFAALGLGAAAILRRRKGSARP